MNLLESAGFSRSNPYYIVKQGKVLWIFFNGEFTVDKEDWSVSILFMFIYLSMVLITKLLKNWIFKNLFVD